MWHNIAMDLRRETKSPPESETKSPLESENIPSEIEAQNFKSQIESQVETQNETQILPVIEPQVLEPRQNFQISNNSTEQKELST